MSNLQDNLCPLCDKGRTKLVKDEYAASLPNGESLRVPDIEMEVCDSCGEIILSLESAGRSIKPSKNIPKDFRARKFARFGSNLTATKPK